MTDCSITLRTIFNHFGEERQLEKLQEEFIELMEAFESGCAEHIREEIAGTLNVLLQFAQEYGFNLVQKEALSQQQRTIKRIEGGFYE